MKTVVIFGAGKSSGVLIDYLARQAASGEIELVVADASEAALAAKTEGLTGLRTQVLSLDDEAARQALVQQASVVISLMPPHLHLLIARDCLHIGRHLLTASYVNEEMKALSAEIAEKNLLFLCEMGLDPGIDHMSALELIHRLQADGYTITDFHSACGGLVAPESDDNPWHYKVSWNARNVVNAGKDGAAFLTAGEVETQGYQEVFKMWEPMRIPGHGILGAYANRNSLDYIGLYGLEGVQQFKRSTLRQPEYLWGWDLLVRIRLTDSKLFYDLENTTVTEFFRRHLGAMGFQSWLDGRLEKLEAAKQILQQLLALMEQEEIAKQKGVSIEDFMTVDEHGELQKVSIQESKQKAAMRVRQIMQETNMYLRQLEFLGWNTDESLLPDGHHSAADILLWLMEKKMMLQPQDKDWVVMCHEIIATKDGETHLFRSALDVKGENARHTAMAATVGLPLGIAAMMLVKEELALRGLHIPTAPELYQPVLTQLASLGIVFKEEMEKLS